MEARGLPTEPFVDYLEAFRYGMPPQGGFAIGLERLLMQLLGLPNVSWPRSSPATSTASRRRPDLTHSPLPSQRKLPPPWTHAYSALRLNDSPSFFLRG